MFICNHCPFVKHLRQHLAGLGKEYQQKGVAIVGINSNDAVNYPDDSPAKMAEEVRTAGYTFPYLYDETQQVAKAFHAACTPDFFLYDKNHKLVYRGQYDASRPDNGKPITGADLRGALDAVLAGKPVRRRPEAEHRLQHQMEAGQRAGQLKGQPCLPAVLSSAPSAPARLAAQAVAQGRRQRRLAVITTEWRERSHAWHMAERFLHGYPINGRWHRPAV